MKNADNPLLPKTARIEQSLRETANVFSIAACPADGSPVRFSPGQFNMVGLPGYGEAPFSFSTGALDGNRFMHTIRRAGNVTDALSRLGPGDTIQIRGPFGNGWPLEKARGRDLVIIGGGIGMAPLRPVVHDVLRDRTSFADVYILSGSRTDADILFRDELRRWSGLQGITVLLSADTTSEGSDMDVHEGLVTELLDSVPVQFARAVSFVCGPEIMMRFVARSLLHRGQQPGDIYLSLERRMKCGIAACGHCQVGAAYVCRDGPVFAYSDIRRRPDTLL